MKEKWEFYKGADIQWRWRRTDPDSNIAEVSNEGYANLPACAGNARCNGWNGVYVKPIPVAPAKSKM